MAYAARSPAVKGQNAIPNWSRSKRCNHLAGLPFRITTAALPAAVFGDTLRGDPAVFRPCQADLNRSKLSQAPSTPPGPPPATFFRNPTVTADRLRSQRVSPAHHPRLRLRPWRPHGLARDRPRP